MRESKYKKELLEEAAKISTNTTEFLVKLDASLTSMSTRVRIKRACLLHGIDISHFKQRRPKGLSSNKKAFSEILVYNRNSGVRENSKRLKRAMIEAGLIEQCTVCKLDPLWNNKTLKLEIDHVDNDPLNNVKDNLRFLCPNCHSQK